VEIEILLNFGIVFLGIFSLLKLNSRKIFAFNVIPVWNPFHLLVLPMSCLFLIPNGIFILFVYCLFYIIKENDYFFESKSYISLEKVFLSIKTLSICWIIFLIVSFISKSLFGELPQQKIVVTIRNSEINKETIEIFFWSVIISPILEEIFFRKIMYSTLKFYFAPIISILSSSLMFSLVHSNLQSFSLLFIFGVTLCLLFEKTNSIIYPIILHSLFNFIMIIFIINS
jgi:membrane protease YdiL (CAAX protease family)